ncbi:MAG: ELM1/GtrOC1 family putative glycosyltransferase [Arcobacter sp.]|uniref:ELM1/GtrOC1 family putative glycosyltransferase n=1 Tax=Arcobacter sp. TaxID=1872629 RepID=UPI003B008DCE
MNKKKVLIISDGKIGHLNQSIAFCKLKNLSYDILEIKKLNKTKKIFSYILDFFNIYINLFSISKIEKNIYKAVVSTGSWTYYSNKYFAQILNIKSIAIMIPRGFRYSDFDYILALEHDSSPEKKNIIKLPLNLSINTPKGLIKRSDKKSLGIVLGGNNTIFNMEVNEIKISLDNIFKKYPNYLKYVTTSRRTPLEIDKLLENYKFDYEVIYSKNSSINPIPDFIEICDELFISIDSTSMLSEAKANSNANLHIIYLQSEKKNTKFHRLAKNILNIKGRFDYMIYLNKVNI